MHWLFLLIGFAILVMSFLTASTAVMVLCWLVALVLFGFWLAAMYSARVASQERGVSMMIDPAELRRLRELAEARKAAADAADASDQAP